MLRASLPDFLRPHPEPVLLLPDDEAIDTTTIRNLFPVEAGATGWWRFTNRPKRSSTWQEPPVDLSITGQVMPGRNGLEFWNRARQIRPEGSGGPLFNRQGQVIGINPAVIPPLPGGSLGFPIRPCPRAAANPAALRETRASADT
jgi:hypothetical protein